jgi:hypothetical protein
MIVDIYVANSILEQVYIITKTLNRIKKVEN